jgi:hypothetical protein
MIGGGRMSLTGQQRILGQLEGENEKEKVELVLHHTAEGSASLEVRSLRWGSGIGWYVQKTINLDPAQVHRLDHLLRRSSIVRRKRGIGGKVIAFPSR